MVQVDDVDRRDGTIGETQVGLDPDDPAVFLRLCNPTRRVADVVLPRLHLERSELEVQPLGALGRLAQVEHRCVRHRLRGHGGRCGRGRARVLLRCGLPVSAVTAARSGNEDEHDQTHEQEAAHRPDLATVARRGAAAPTASGTATACHQERRCLTSASMRAPYSGSAARKCAMDRSTIPSPMGPGETCASPVAIFSTSRACASGGCNR